MIIQFKAATSKSLIQDFCERQRQAGVVVYQSAQHVALIGLKEVTLTAAEQTGVDSMTTDEPSYVLSSRLFQPENTIIQLPHSTIGGEQFTMMAGPCSVESAEHILAMAKVAKEGGATLLRGGAYKPRDFTLLIPRNG